MKPPKKPKMSKERYLELFDMMCKTGNNTVIPEDEWCDFWIAQKYFSQHKTLFGPGYVGQ